MKSLTKFIFSALILILASTDTYSQTEDCLSCHTDDTLTKERNGKTVSLYVNQDKYENSVHGGLDCNDCHQGFDAFNIPHKEGTDIYKVNCTFCHSEIDDIQKGDIHQRLKGKVSAKLPDCVTCHGNHAIVSPSTVQNKTEFYCSQCHDNIQLSRNYHKKNLLANENCSNCHETAQHAADLAQSVHSQFTCIDCHSYVAQNFEQHTEDFPVAKIAECSLCHSDAMSVYKESIHGISLVEGVDEAAKCWDCHGSHLILPVDNPKSSAYVDNLPQTCGECHDNPAFSNKYDLINQRSGVKFSESFHMTMVKQGKIPDMNCISCHGAHDIKNRIQPGSKISTYNISTTCGKCHEEVKHDYENSIHWIRAKKGIRVAPVCSDCHSEHSLQALQVAEGKFSHTKFQEEICISCHQDPILTSRYGLSQEEAYSYQDSYHGLAVMRGDKNAARCIDCHRTHRILPKDNPESSVNPANVRETCMKCHKDATQVFAESYSHVTQSQQAREVESIVNTIYFWLIVVVIGGMVLHNMLIFVFEVKKRRRQEKNSVTVPRFTKNEVVQHVFLFVSFIVLAITGFALKYTNSFWSEGLLQLGMTEPVRQLIHRISAVVMMTLGVYHILYLLLTKRGRDILLNLVPKFEDAKQAVDNVLYYLRIKKHQPEFNKYDYTEKAEYWALIWGTLVMGVTGLILWFPTLVGDWAPVWLIKVSETIHFYEAILATLAIIVWHWFFVIFRPSEYPMSFVWIDGKMSLQRYKHHHEAHFKNIVLEHLEVKHGKREPNKISHSTELFINTLEKNGLNADEVISGELQNDPELRNWVNEKLNLGGENEE